MLLRQLFDRESSTYSYLVGDERSGEALLIDPVKEQTGAYVQLLNELQLTLEMAVDTHVHADHVTALGTLRNITGCQTLMGQQSGAECNSGTFKDGDVFLLGTLNVEVMYTPGHTDDSYCFYLESGSDKYLFRGDTLLIRGTGRTDFQNGNARQQYQSLVERLMTLPDETRVYPGHDYKGWTVSTIAEERQFNPRLQVSSAEEYEKLMASLHMPNPKLMDLAVPANRKCGLKP